jgi:hypothetical protein
MVSFTVMTKFMDNQKTHAVNRNFLKFFCLIVSDLLGLKPNKVIWIFAQGRNRVKESYISCSTEYNRTGMDVTGDIGKKRGEPEITG